MWCEDPGYTKWMSIDKFRMINATFKRPGLQVACTAGHHRVGVGTSRNPSVIKKFPAKFNSLYCHRIVRGDIQLSWKPERDLDLV